jgi:T4 superinfection immunity protein
MLVVLILIVALIFFLPSIIALARGHEYRTIIVVLNLFGWTGVCWLGSLVWAVWPANKSLIDPILGNVTGLGERNAGDTLGEVEFGKRRGFGVAGHGDRGRREPRFDFFQPPQLQPPVDLTPEVGVPYGHWRRNRTLVGSTYLQGSQRFATRGGLSTANANA